MKAKEQLFARNEELKKRELRLKNKHEEETLAIELERSKIELEQENREVDALEQELGRIDNISITAADVHTNNEIPVPYEAQPPEAAIIDEVQTEGVGDPHRNNRSENPRPEPPRVEREGYVDAERSGNHSNSDRMVNLLQSQIEISTAIARCQQSSFLPKKGIKII